MASATRRADDGAAGLAVPLLPTISFAETSEEAGPMSTIKVGQENSQPIELYYEDHGSGRRLCSSMDGH